jgi:RNA polymerase sigma-70 factor, ECF subfamily
VTGAVNRNVVGIVERAAGVPDRPASESVEMAIGLSDEALVERTLGGDEEGFATLYDRYRGPVFATAYRIIQGTEAARDATQEIFIKMYRSLRSWNPEKAKFSTWLYRLAANHAIDCWRERRRRGETQIPDEAPDAESLVRQSRLAEAIRSPYEAAERGERVDEVRRRIDMLPDLQKKVFVLRYFGELKLEEIAEVESCSLGTVKTSLFRATQTLRRALLKGGDRR